MIWCVFVFKERKIKPRRKVSYVIVCMCARVYAADIDSLMWYDALLFVDWTFAVQCSVYDNAPGVQASRTDYLKWSCHLAFGFIIKMVSCMYVCFYIFGCLCVCVTACVHAAHLQCCVINDSRGEWTSAVSPFWLFSADLVWVGHSGHKASGDLKILGFSLTCTSASALREYFHLLRAGSAVSTQGHTFNHRERTLTVYSHSFLLYAENLPLKGQNGSLRGQSRAIIRLV